MLWETPHRLTYYTLRVSTSVLREVGEDIKIIFLYLVLETQGHYKDTSGPTILPSTLLKHSLFFPLASPLWQKKKKKNGSGHLISANYKASGMSSVWR